MNVCQDCSTQRHINVTLYLQITAIAGDQMFLKSDIEQVENPISKQIGMVMFVFIYHLEQLHTEFK